jgi:hypothetical protein
MPHHSKIKGSSLAATVGIGMAKSQLLMQQFKEQLCNNNFVSFDYKTA